VLERSSRRWRRSTRRFERLGFEAVAKPKLEIPAAPAYLAFRMTRLSSE